MADVIESIPIILGSPEFDNSARGPAQLGVRPIPAKTKNADIIIVRIFIVILVLDD
jgi:hypothetical protein